MAKGKKTGGGSRAGKPNKATADIKALAQKYVPAAIAELGRLATEADTHSARVAAIKELFDRAYGKAPQAITGGDGGPLIVRAVNYGG